ncbi:MAG: SBBP repeat-containing protein [Bryobacteraceae bacterium]|nr:SBBP repeat-containing protein [Bryobacterales bacterium]NUN00449.1 SBBP repeat-containing protein [Bryobacteraceae bacterium]
MRCASLPQPVRRNKNNLRLRATGNGAAVPGFLGANALEIFLRTPPGIAIDNAGNIYVADYANHHVLRIAPDSSVY